MPPSRLTRSRLSVHIRSMIATAPISPSQSLDLPRRKTASGGLQPWTRRRVGPNRPQPTGTPWKNRLRYDLGRRGAVLPAKPKAEKAINVYATHRYFSYGRITSRDTDCSEGQASEAVNRNAVPGNYQQHTSGQNYPVSFAGKFQGTISFFESSDGLHFQNTTLDDHNLCCGLVRLTLSGNRSFGFTVGVVGTGYNRPYGPFTSMAMAKINEYVGEKIFNNAIQSMNRDLLGMCGG